MKRVDEELLAKYNKNRKDHNLNTVTKEQVNNIGWELKLNLIESGIPSANIRKVLFYTINNREFLELIIRTTIWCQFLSCQEYLDEDQDAKS